MPKKKTETADSAVSNEKKEVLSESKPKRSRKSAPKTEAVVDVKAEETAEIKADAPTEKPKKSGKKAPAKKNVPAEVKAEETAEIKADAPAEKPKKPGKKAPAKKDAPAEVKAEETAEIKADAPAQKPKKSGKKTPAKKDTPAEVKAEETTEIKADAPADKPKKSGKKAPAKKDAPAEVKAEETVEIKADAPAEKPKKPGKKAPAKKNAPAEVKAEETVEIKADAPAEKPKKPGKKAPSKKKAPAKKTAPEKKERVIHPLSEEERNAIFAAVFGYAKTEKKAKKSSKKPAKKPEPKAEPQPVKTEPTKAEAPKPEVQPKEAPKKVYERILPTTQQNKPKEAPKPAEKTTKKETSFFSFGKLSAEDIAALSKKKTAEPKPEPKADKPAKNNKNNKAPKKSNDKKNEPKATETAKPQQKKIKPLTKAQRDAIFAAVFGYEIRQPKPEAPAVAGQKAEKKPSPKQEKTAPKKKKQKSTLFNMFNNRGKKKRQNFTAPQKPTKAKPVITPLTKEQRDEIFAKVFGYEYVAKTPAKPAAAKPEKVSKKAESKKPEAKKTESKKEPSADEFISSLIHDSYTGEYPRYAIRKPLTDEEKSRAASFEGFFRSRGYNLEFNESGATKTGIVTSKIIESGSMVNVLDFFNKTKSEISKQICGGEDAFRNFVESDKKFFVSFDSSKRRMIETARSFGIVTDVKERNDGTCLVYFSKVPKVIDYFRGGFLESYAYYVAKAVAKKVADKYKLPFDVAANAIISDKNGNVIHEYDTMIKVGNTLFILEEKSSRYFSDFDKFHRDMDELRFNKKNYMILLMNKNAEEMEAIEWFFDFRIANLSTYADKLEQMITEALDDLTV